MRRATRASSSCASCSGSTRPRRRRTRRRPTPRRPTSTRSSGGREARHPRQRARPRAGARGGGGARRRRRGGHDHDVGRPRPRARRQGAVGARDRRGAAPRRRRSRGALGGGPAGCAVRRAVARRPAGGGAGRDELASPGGPAARTARRPRRARAARERRHAARTPARRRIRRDRPRQRGARPARPRRRGDRRARRAGRRARGRARRRRASRPARVRRGAGRVDVGARRAQRRRPRGARRRGRSAAARGGRRRGPRAVTPGTVYLVGAGPGDPRLGTPPALGVIPRADVILHDRLIPLEALRGARDDAEVIDVGKIGGGEQVPQEETTRLVVEYALAGRDVVRLKGGDPFVFGRGGEEAQACRAAGVPFEVVPGVTAGVAAPAYAGIPVTHRGLASAVAFVTGHEDPAKPETAIDWEALARFPGTLVLYMGVGTLPEISERLIAAGRDPAEPAAVLSSRTPPPQRAGTP